MGLRVMAILHQHHIKRTGLYATVTKPLVPVTFTPFVTDDEDATGSDTVVEAENANQAPRFAAS